MTYAAPPTQVIPAGLTQTAYVTKEDRFSFVLRVVVHEVLALLLHQQYFPFAFTHSRCDDRAQTSRHVALSKVDHEFDFTFYLSSSHHRVLDAV